MDMIINRLEKNAARLRSWIKQTKVEAYRLYDRDIPEYPFIVDVYGSYYLIYDKSNAELDRDKNHLPHVAEALQLLYAVPDEHIITKIRSRQEGTNQYQKMAQTQEYFVVHEGPAKYKINVWDYLDTGLFLDHRPSRSTIFKNSKDKTFLNLFCYTGSVSVMAALGGAKTVSIDMSNTYINWAKDNFLLNDLDLEKHEFIQADVLLWMKTERFGKKFDSIFLDPPTFSNSKRMEEFFEVEKDQKFLVESCMEMLNPGGVLYFSTNKRKFKLDPELADKFHIKETTEKTIPIDFWDKKIHTSFEVRHPKPIQV